MFASDSTTTAGDGPTDGWIISGAFFERLAELMGIPQHNRDHFGFWLYINWSIEGQTAASNLESGRRHDAKIDADIVKTARAFMRAINRRNARPTVRTDLDRNRMMVKEVDKYLQCIEPPKRGRRERRERTDRFEEFLECTLSVVKVLGGHVRFNRKKGNGNVVDMLDKLRPIMPAGFFPEGLPMSLIERLTTQANTLGRSIERDPHTAKVALTIATGGWARLEESALPVASHPAFVSIAHTHRDDW